MANIMFDVRYSIRTLLKSPGIAIASVIALMLGIAANTSVFSVVNATLFRPLPYQDSERLLMVWENRGAANKAQINTSYPNFMDWKAQNQVFELMAATAGDEFNLAGRDEPERLSGLRVSTDIFPILHVQPALGRSFLPEEQAEGKNHVVILSHGLWQRRFGGDPSVIGSAVTLTGESYTVVGVLPPNFRYPPNESSKSELWTPLIANEDRGQDYLDVVARLKPGVTIEQARASMDGIIRNLKQAYPDTNTGESANVVPLHEFLVGEVRTALLIFLLAVAFVLLIACVNIAGLLLSRALMRQKEIAVRIALGASRWQVMQLILIESMVLALLGGVLGVLLTFWGVDYIVSFIPTSTIPRVGEIKVDTAVLLFTLLISLITGLLCGVAPALQATRINPNTMLKESGRGQGEGARGNRLRKLLLAAEIALSLMLLVSAGLLTRSFYLVRQISPGFESENRLSMRIDLPAQTYTVPRQRTVFYKELIQRLQSLPEVKSVGAVNCLPFTEYNSKESFTIEGRPNPGPSDLRSAEYRVISPDYFKAMGIPVVQGRAFTENDVVDAPKAAIVNESMARQLWPGQDPIGRVLYITLEQKMPRQIVGVVRDVRQVGFITEPKPQMYIPFTQRSVPGMHIVVHTNTDPLKAINAVRSQVYAIDKNQPVYDIRAMNQLLSKSVETNRFGMLLLNFLSFVALILALIGVYGVTSYSVSQRTHEIGIRLALGAQASDILKLVVRQAMLPVLIGIIVGLCAAFAGTKVLDRFLYGITSSDPLTYVSISLIFVTVALVASFVPALRATRVDPMNALRYE